MKATLNFPILLVTLLSITTTHGNESDQEALLAIKAEITIDPHSSLSSWNNSLDFCDWDGITCGRTHQRVVGLDLSDSNLVGTLSPFIGNLSFLSRFVLYNNSFRGNIPRQISSLRRLQVIDLGRNYFEGEIPANLSHCLQLNYLFLGFNNLTGKIPTQLVTLPNLRVFNVLQNNLYGNLHEIGIGNFSTSLKSLVLSFNHFEGSIPDDIGRLIGLDVLGLSANELSGTIPASIFNLSNLTSLDLSSNKFHGNLPQDLGLRLPRLSYFYVAQLSLSGQVPTSLSNLSELVVLQIPYNSFTGKFLFDASNMPQLKVLGMQYAFPLEGEARDLNFLDTLTNCTSLSYLLISGNSFKGSFPSSILNLSTSIEQLDLGDNQIFGEIPLGLGKFANLISFWLNDNLLTGHIPLDIGNMEILQGLALYDNKLSGEIPSSLGNLSTLSSLQMDYNNLQGSLPKSFANFKVLQQMSLSSNNFSGSFPNVLFQASSLTSLWLDQNNFEGSLPIEISRLRNLDQLDVSQNRFSGEIPSSLGEFCTSLTFLDMSRNSFDGSIPKSFSSLRNILHLNLSLNNFSGQIPNYFSEWPSLTNLNLSFNNFVGEVPTNGIFANTSVVSVVGNDKLCGGAAWLNLPRCPKPKKRLSSRVIMITSITCALIVVFSVSLCLYFILSSRKRKEPPMEVAPQSLKVSYQMLHMATDGFSTSNLLGVGGFGSVYKGILKQDGTELVVAVKVMNLGNERASKSFITECKALRNIRHRNLVKVITACSSIDARRRDFKALVYEFMSRGSLEDWLHSPNNASLSLFQRLSIAIDVASALEYLHVECFVPIIHCDLKPSNILLDDEMTARVSDFGIAKFVSGALTSNTKDHTSSTQVRGTVGYTAPEYGIGSKVSPEGDIYSLGIIILELMTSKKPTDPMFNNGLNLHDFVKAALPNRVVEIIDHKMFGDVNGLREIIGTNNRKMECIDSVMMIGVQCSMELPHERMNVKDVVNKLKSARQNLLAHCLLLSVTLRELDLAQNYFQGEIPANLSRCLNLKVLDPSFNNDLSADVPTHGIFANTSAISIVGNDKLCGGVLQVHLPRCPEPLQVS
ncbi:hypothetical protein V2J09_007225 [Rumex salicifolius]